jgi:hypothetical protein
MVAFGDATIVCRGLYSHSWWLIRCSPEQPRQALLLPDAVERTLARTPGGFVVAIRDGMWFGTAEGHLSRFVRWNTLPSVRRKTKRLVCADPTTGRLAIYRFGTLLMADADGSVLATATSDGFRAGVFCAPGHLITVHPLGDTVAVFNYALVSWRHDGTNLVREAKAECRIDGTLIPVPGHDLVLTPFEGRRFWFDTGTLKEADPPSAFPRWAGGSSRSPKTGHWSP